MTISEIEDIADLRSAFGDMPAPFASSGQKVSPGDESGVTYVNGIPAVYSTPIADGGKMITRQIINYLANMGTSLQFYEQCGGLFDFDSDVCNRIGGYPKGAVLSHYYPDINRVREVVSLVENNTVDFRSAGVDGINWQYCDAPFIGDLMIFPDFSSAVSIAKSSFYTLTRDGEGTFTPDADGWTASASGILYIDGLFTITTNTYTVASSVIAILNGSITMQIMQMEQWTSSPYKLQSTSTMQLALPMGSGDNIKFAVDAMYRASSSDSWKLSSTNTVVAERHFSAMFVPFKV